eukprot:TRINITY_DN2493_c0_g1_i16.p1 TRINITY_DN2493_c0_g1~~TRINITY_DN2493_c0_g1_i16.p1  ORF type:complete len:378 (+),score=101.63 TRINITY_DN2493_c0_g1_i16:494-1627(+)
MSAKNIALVFAPNLLRTKTESVASMLGDAQYSYVLVQSIISQPEKYFETEVETGIEEMTEEMFLNELSIRGGDVSFMANQSPGKQLKTPRKRLEDHKLSINVTSPRNISSPRNSDENDPPSLLRSSRMEKKDSTAKDSTTSSTENLDDSKPPTGKPDLAKSSASESEDHSKGHSFLNSRAPSKRSISQKAARVPKEERENSVKKLLSRRRKGDKEEERKKEEEKVDMKTIHEEPAEGSDKARWLSSLSPDKSATLIRKSSTMTNKRQIMTSPHRLTPSSIEHRSGSDSESVSQEPVINFESLPSEPSLDEILNFTDNPLPLITEEAPGQVHVNEEVETPNPQKKISFSTPPRRYPHKKYSFANNLKNHNSVKFDKFN